ncbi:sigma factor sigB regulation protein [Cytophaga hutchinsonii ATCC 33406]|uniref:Sigma factor sigB regulation protein n=1 Tax=Cytophaga hutchinsonii (strain ATCC 33406 / DSM 1761 / CIP 103989 / NBRC 15051 / NCIMB 9469 / D465) TaxID=269798 RepID=A0A6N4SMH9_CYTH3|nr:sigma factor sigB regulation protein [Cytophaga hutchinsonii ATCC 33406]SFW98480.1 GAF domain-containing protein [Cytophaga hutchinsonii ATCC 33406]
MNLKNLRNIYFLLAFVSWVLILADDITVIRLAQPIIPSYFSDILVNTFLSTFFLFTFLGFKIEIGLKRSGNFNDLLWQVFIIGAITVLISLIIKSIGIFSNNDFFIYDPLVSNILYHINIGIITIFLANGYYVWKKMILYQKTKRTDVIWHIFEYLTLISIVSNFFFFDITDPYFLIFTSPITILGLICAFNLKWVAFLTYKQKWRSILLLSLIIIISLSFLERVYAHHIISNLLIDLAENVFIQAIFGFMLMNCIVALLVLLFNLPTSSVFEQKFGEVMLFQKLHQSLQVGEKEEDMYELLISSSMTTVMADAAWLEIRDNKGGLKAFQNSNIDEYDVFEIKKALRKNQVNISSEPQYIKDILSYPHTEKIKHLDYKSFLLIPLTSNNQLIGTLVLLKNLNDGFDKEMVDIIFTFVSQASISIKNFRLMSDAIQTERYQEELKIAKDVQQSLLPASLYLNNAVQLSVYSKGAKEVGGDYYDVYELSPTRFAIVIGDVSGHGTSAAFNMAQMKGVFQSLVSLDLPVDEFMVLANNALGRCLERKSFITLSLFVLNTETQSIQYARAGHCPAILIDSKNNEALFLDGKGLGLGLSRNNTYEKHINKYELSYSSNDVLILYTDGLVEAHNLARDEYGYERLKQMGLESSADKPRQIIDTIIENVQHFSGSTQFEDDCTLLVMKFS